MDSSVLQANGDIFSSEEKLLGTLVTVRNAALPTEQKAAIRDLILDYAGSTDEAAKEKLKGEITKQLAALNPAQPKAVVPPPPQSKPIASNIVLGRSRTAPSFVIKQTPIAPPKPVEEVPVVPTPEVKETTTPPPPPAPTVKIEPEVKKEETPQPVQSSGAKNRINEIKHDINQKVGNPINLINADEALGKEYMAALLGAMKESSTNGATGGPALTRLETVYKKAVELLATKDLNSIKHPKPVEKPIVKAPVADIPKPAPAPLPPPPPAAPAKPETKKSSILSSMLLRNKNAETPTPTQASVSPAVNPISTPGIRKMTFKTDEPKAEAVPPPDKLSPVSNATALPEKIANIRQKSIDREEDAKKPISDLQNEKVTLGLKQLLSEWKLFKGQGWFGSGPTGMDSVLYKNIYNLPMAVIVAGRFEGATPEIRHTIADYMNGWRYEQGIAHEMGESFETYLRRVVLHIMENQRVALPTEVKKT